MFKKIESILSERIEFIYYSYDDFLRDINYEIELSSRAPSCI